MAPNLGEAAYPGNIGFEELIEFYKKASKSEITKMEKIIESGSWDKFKSMIEKVVGVKLK